MYGDRKNEDLESIKTWKTSTHYKILTVEIEDTSYQGWKSKTKVINDKNWKQSHQWYKLKTKVIDDEDLVKVLSD